MTKIKVTASVGEIGNLGNFYSADPSAFQIGPGPTDEKATFLDTETGNSFTFNGTGFEYSQTGMTAGTIEKITFNDADGHRFVSLEDGSYAVTDVMQAFANGIKAVYGMLLQGDDTMVGSKIGDYLFAGGGDDFIKGGRGNDVIEGGTGDDILVGRAGADTFIFDPGLGSDVINDFDANGGNGKQDVIETHTHNFSISQVGDDVVIDFHHGDTLTLLGVDIANISKDDDFSYVS